MGNIRLPVIDFGIQLFHVSIEQMRKLRRFHSKVEAGSMITDPMCCLLYPVLQRRERSRARL